MNKAKIRSGVIHDHVSLKKEETFGPTNLFCSHIKVDHFHPRVMLAMSAADLEVDNLDCGLDKNIEWLNILNIYVQHRGSRILGIMGIHNNLVAGVSSYLSAYIGIGASLLTNLIIMQTTI